MGCSRRFKEIQSDNATYMSREGSIGAQGRLKLYM